MAHITADRVSDTSTSTSTGNFVVSGTPPVGFRTLSAVLSVSDTFYYAIQLQGTSEWEVGIGTYSSANTFARTTVLASSNAGSAVNFSAGTKEVFLTLAAARTVQLDNDGDVIISANSSSDALRITQTGAGNALLVEDSANPDSSPFVVDANGRVVVAKSSPQTTTNTGTPVLQSHVVGQNQLGLYGWSTSSTAPADVRFLRSASGTIGTLGAVSSGFDLGALGFYGDDGTDFIEAAEIFAEVDGTPGTNDMPGRLIFSTTADGAATPTERMRVDSAGGVGIGGTAAAGTTLRVTRNVTGAVTASAIRADGSIQSDVTTTGRGFTSVLNVAAAATVGTVEHFGAAQGTFGVGSAVTNQYGFHAISSLTGATNNYGFFGNIASGTGRWNFYANGTAANFFSGQVQLGAGTVGAPALSTTGDTNTGMFFPAADTIAFAEGGAEAMRLDSSGNVGIGTTTITQKLTVNGSASASNYYLGVAAGTYGVASDTSIEMYGSASSQVMLFKVNGNTERMRIDSSGNVGIGNSAANVNDQVGGVRPLLVSGSDAATTIAGSLASVVIGNANTTTSNTSQLGFAALTGANSTYFTSAAINCIFGARTNAQYPTGQLTFSTSTSLNSAPTEKFRIGSAGQLGIGGANYGTSGQVLTSGGSGAAPSWAAAGGVTSLAAGNGITVSGSTGAVTVSQDFYTGTSSTNNSYPVSSYVMMTRVDSDDNINLNVATALYGLSSRIVNVNVGNQLTGTWRCRGGVGKSWDTGQFSAILFQRVA